MKKLKKLKIDTRFFNTFYSKLIKLAAKVEFTKEMLL